MSAEEIHKMAAEAVEWQKLGLRHVPLSAGSVLITMHSNATEKLLTCCYQKTMGDNLLVSMF
jgi:hypothetical protein